MLEKFPAIIGILFMLSIVFLFSNNKKAINKKTLFWGIFLQFLIAVLILKGEIISSFLVALLPFSMRISQVISILLLFLFWAYYKSKDIKKIIPPRIFLLINGIVLFFFLLHGNLITWFFDKARIVVAMIIQYTEEGTKFVFGSLGYSKGVAGLVFALQVLPTIIFVAAIFATLYYLGIMQKIVAFFARIMINFLGTSGAESTSVAASLFMGQTEAPLTIRPYLSNLTMSELFTIMIAGFAHVSAGIMPAYVLVGQVDIKHLLCAVLMTAPGSILIAKMLLPEVQNPKTGKQVKVDVPITDVNLLDALARGTTEGGKLALNVTAMLISFIALISLINAGLGWLHAEICLLAAKTSSIAFIGTITHSLQLIMPAKLEQLFGWIFSPLAWAMGVPIKDIPAVGGLVGTRMVLNEFVAFIDLAKLKAVLDPKSFIIATYALCGFANFASIAIQIGGIGALVPERRHDLAKLGMKAMFAGSIANFLSAAIVALLI